jgi:pyruvate dehydrogenase E2 component (dihydrolipoamide acetyltransferase)
MEVAPDVRVRVQAHEVFMPALSSTMTEGKIVQWSKKVGDRIEKGDIIIVVESDKADMDVESFEDGYLAQILVKEGETAAVGATVGLIAKSVEDIEAIQSCGLDCVVDGSGSRHDGTTAVAPHGEEQAQPTRTTLVSSPGESSPRDSSTTKTNAEATAVKPPGTVELFMPALSSTMTEGKIVQWMKTIGDEVQPGDVIMVVESDKADMDVESFDRGFLAHVAIEAGGSSPVGTVVGYLAPDRASIPVVQAWAKGRDGRPVDAGSSVNAQCPPASANVSGAPTTDGASSTAASASAVSDIGAATIDDQLPETTGRVIASPYAKRLAKDHNVDLRLLKGRGPGGRIVAADVQAAVLARSAQKTISPSSAAPEDRVDSSGRVMATPGAKKLAKARGVDLTKLQGSGPYGRITEDDVRHALGEAPKKVQSSEGVSAAASPVSAQSDRGASSGGSGLAENTKNRVDTPKTDRIKTPEKASMAGPVAMNALQKAVVNNMNAALQTPVFRVSYRIATDAVDGFLARVKPKGVTMSTLLAKAIGITLQKHPLLNARFEEPYTIVYQPKVNVAVAVALPDGGLITPVLRDCAETDLYELSRRWRSLVRMALEKKLKPDDYQSGTFTLSNLGMYGVSSFDAILPKGVGAILAVSASQPEVRLQPNGLIGVSKVMQVTITCDHRHIYGAQAAEFLRDLAGLLENRVEELLY